MVVKNHLRLFAAKKQEEGNEEEPSQEEMEEILSNLFQPQLNLPDQMFLNSRGIMFIDGVITKRSVEEAMKRLWVLHFDLSFTDDVQLIINSPGGYTDAGWAFIDTMEAVRLNIRTIAMGSIASMATMIFCAGDERLISPNTTSMIHHFSTGIMGTYKDLVANNKMMDMEYGRMVRHFIKHSKYTTEKEVVTNLLKDQDNYLTPKEMKSHGLCDHIFTPYKREKNVKKTK